MRDQAGIWLWQAAKTAQITPRKTTARPLHISTAEMNWQYVVTERDQNQKKTFISLVQFSF